MSIHFLSGSSLVAANLSFGSFKLVQHDGWLHSRSMSILIKYRYKKYNPRKSDGTTYNTNHYNNLSYSQANKWIQCWNTSIYYLQAITSQFAQLDIFTSSFDDEMKRRQEVLPCYRCPTFYKTFNNLKGQRSNNIVELALIFLCHMDMPLCSLMDCYHECYVIYYPKWRRYSYSAKTKMHFIIVFISILYSINTSFLTSLTSVQSEDVPLTLN